MASHGIDSRAASAAPASGVTCRSRRLRKMEHQQRWSRPPTAWQAGPTSAIAERRLHRELRQRAAGERQPAETEREDRGRHQHRPQRAGRLPGATPTARNSAPFTSDVVRGVEARRPARPSLSPAASPMPNTAAITPHLADAGIGQDRFRDWTG